MKKFTIVIGVLAALVVLVGAFFLWDRARQDETTNEPIAADDGAATDANGALPTTAPADETDDAAEPTNGGDSEEPVEDTADLTLLPRLDGGGASATGLGGGGAPAGEFQATDSVAGSMIMPMMDIFSGTIFTLNGSLPTEPAVAVVQQQPTVSEMDLATAQAIAQRFGFSGELYIEQFPAYVDEIALESGETYTPPTVYHAFDGSRRLFIDSWGAYYNDNSQEFDYRNTMPYEQALPLAEAFATDLGLLDFPYQTAAGYGPEVFFYRLINGVPTNQPELVVTVNGDGTIPFASYQGVRQVDNLGRYPLLSAADAWAKLQSGVMENNIPYTFLPNPEAEMAVYEDPFAELYQYWPRTYASGEEIHIYEWPIVFRPAESDGAPRIEMFGFVLDADPAILNEIAESAGSQVHVWGQVNEENKTVAVAGWEPFESNEPVSEEGVISRVGDEVRFTGSISGMTYTLPNAPADIEDGLEVYVFAWNFRESEAEFPLLDWNSIEKLIDYDAVGIEDAVSSEMPPLEGPGTPFTGYGEVVIDAVGLEYYYTYIWPEVDEDALVNGRGTFQNPTILIQPTWKFTGSTDTGDLLAFYVQAVDEAFLQGE
jgi:hypothetical protein